MNKSAFKDAINRLVEAYSSTFQEDARNVINRVTALLEKGYDVYSAVNLVLEESEFFRKNENNLKENIFRAAAIGYGLEPKIVIPAARAVVIQKLTVLPWAPDKLNLSARLHGVEPAMRQKIAETIQNTVREGANVIRTARALYEGYGYGRVMQTAELPAYLDNLVSVARHHLKNTSPATMRDFLLNLKEATENIKNLAANDAPTRMLKAAYEKLLNAVTNLNEKAINNAVYVAMMEKSRYMAERIGRTEIARAWSDGFFAATYDDPDVEYYKWSLSSRHPQFDICDFHAGVDAYGLGRGVYPKNRMPVYPAHPHCTCQLSEVIAGSIRARRSDNVQRAGNKFLRSLSADQRDALLTFKGAEAWANGEDWRTYLNNWQGHVDPNPRLKRSDFE